MTCKWTTLILAALIGGTTSAQEGVQAPAAQVLRRDLLEAALAPAKTVSTVSGKEITLAPRQKAPAHLHPCPVVGVVLSGTIAFQVEGGPVRILRAGDGFYEPAGARISRFDNDGETPARFTAFYLLGPEDHEFIRLLPQ